MEKLKIFAKTVEESAHQQILEMNTCEAYKDNYVRIMPDCHAGSGCTIGTVIAIGDRIVPNTVGVDIGCGMLVVELGRVDIDLEKFDKVVNEKIPSGFNIHEKVVMGDLDIFNLRCSSVVDFDMAQRSIGSLGGGNHFIELNVDSADNKYLVIHSGSRNLGVRVCNHYQKLAIKKCKEKEFDATEIINRLKAEGKEQLIGQAIKEAKAACPKINKDLAYLEGEDAEDYLHDMVICQSYASLNRQTMADIILKEMNLTSKQSFETIHNYIDVEHKILRKGAVRALNGERLIIPMNMRDGSLICEGKGNLDWLYSAPHGAGRLMSRTEAFKSLDMEQFKEEMKDVYSTSVCEETIDESPMAYKPMQEIIECIEPTVWVMMVIKPIYNFKAKEKSNR